MAFCFDSVACVRHYVITSRNKPGNATSSVVSKVNVLSFNPAAVKHGKTTQ